MTQTRETVSDQPAKKTMRTRSLNALTNWEVESYLERSDIIIVPVGANELHGPCPLDCEYVMAEAFARLLAEQVDGLVMPGLIYYHPGATQIGRGTVHMSMSDGFQHILAIMESLASQGFRRQIYIPGHPPTSQFLQAACTEFFDTHKIPVLHMDIINVMDRAKAFDSFPLGSFTESKAISDEEGISNFAVMTASYKICNRLQDFPCGEQTNRPEILGDYPHENAYWAPLFRILDAGTTKVSVSPAFYFSDQCEHGFGPLPETKAQIEREADIGEAFLKRGFARYDFNPMIENLRLVDRYQNTVIMEKYGDRLPKNKLAKNKPLRFAAQSPQNSQMHGDMPDDEIRISQEHIEKADVLYPHLKRLINLALTNRATKRVVISVFGGSGVGKSEIASLLAQKIQDAGIPSYILSGDNYPRRIPKYNDAERLSVFRTAGMRALAAAELTDQETRDALALMQREDRDAEPSELGWHGIYRKAGTVALESYLGGPAEIDFDELNGIVAAFKGGAVSIPLKRMGRDECALWYETVHFPENCVLIIEWTHGNSPYLQGVDLPIFLYSTPEETLAHRLLRARDKNADSAFTSLVLKIEQGQLDATADRAKLILNKNGRLLEQFERK